LETAQDHRHDIGRGHPDIFGDLIDHPALGEVSADDQEELGFLEQTGIDGAADVKRISLPLQGDPDVLRGRDQTVEGHPDLKVKLRVTFR
jgi:hypothetical protein